MTSASYLERHNAVWDTLKSDYAAGKNSRFRPQPTGTVPSGSGADYHYADHTAYLRMIERSRHFDRNNIVVAQGVDRLVDNVVQDGFTLQVETGDADVDREIMDLWQAWSHDADAVDIEGENTWTDFERLCMRHSVVDGDIIGLLHRTGTLQAVEGHRLRHPRNTTRNVVHGILLSDNDKSYGKRLEYWLTKEDLSPYRQISRVSEIRRYAVRDSAGMRQVLHCYNPRRISQRRGVTAFAPSVDVMGMHDDLQFAHLVKAQVASCFAIIEEYELHVSRAGKMRTGAQTAEELRDGTTRTLEGLGPGMRVKGQPGAKLSGFAPNIPNPEFFPHATLLLTFIAINLGIPVSVLLLDPANTNFSGWRGAIDQARQGFKNQQRWLINRLHKPTYAWKLRQFTAESPRLRRAAEELGPAFFNHVWNPPTWRYIEPQKDAAADALRLHAGLISPRRRAAEQGFDQEVIARETVEDNAYLIEQAIEAANRINGKYPKAEVDWREVAYGSDRKGIPITLAQPEPEPPPAPAGNNGSNGSRAQWLRQ